MAYIINFSQQGLFGEASRMKYVRILLSIGCLAITGCTSARGPQFATMALPAVDQAKLCVYRPWRSANCAMYPTVLLNQESIGNLRNGGYLEVVVPPGNYTLSLKIDRGLGLLVKPWDIFAPPITINLLAGKTEYVKLLSDAKIDGAQIAAAFITVPLTGVAVFTADRKAALVLVNEKTATQELSELHRSD